MLFLPSAAREVVDELTRFVRNEFDAQRQAHRSRSALPLSRRAHRGTCLPNLRFTRLDEAGFAVFAHAGNDSRLREGDRVLLSRDDPGNGLAATLYREEKTQLWLAKTAAFDSSIFAENPGLWTIDESFVDLEGRYLETLERLAASQTGQERILPLLSGEAQPGLDEDEFEARISSLAAEDTPWEEAQQEAIAGCLASDHCYLVQGPPGTGKTRVLAQVVRQLVERGERVLVTAFTHRAIDNALSAAVRELGDASRAARICLPVHRRDENFQRFPTFVESHLATLRGGWVAAATPFALKHALGGIEFDTIVIDEAGQMTTPLAIMAMLAGRKYLLFGDHCQLGPVVTCLPRREAGSFSIFHRLRRPRNPGTCLDVTWRLNDVLAEWPSENFYGGELQPAPSVAPRRLALALPHDPEPWVRDALDPASPLVWMPFDRDTDKTTNSAEVAVAARLLQVLHQSGVRGDDVAVVTPYRSQARRIRTLLESMTPETFERACVIDTVERMQGQEREVILLSLCASDPEWIQKQSDFLFDPSRLNVSATRCRSKLVVLASQSLVCFDTDDADLEEDIRLLRSLRDASRLVDPPAAP